MAKLYRWLAYSSVNANEWSLTVRGLAGFIPSALILFGLVHLNVSGDTLLEILDGAAKIIAAFGTAVTAMLTIAGIVRKIILTWRGEHDTQ